MKVLLTGASGFIGHHCLERLVAGGCEVHALSRTKPDVDGVTWHSADLTDLATTTALVKNIRATHLLQLAWHPIRGGIWSAQDSLSWISTWLNIARAFASAGGERIVGVGTCGEYDWQGGLCVEDITRIKPSTFYGACKSACNSLLSADPDLQHLSQAWTRVFFVYGPREHPSRLLADLANNLLGQQRVSCTHGLQIRDYLHVKDVADGIVSLLNADIVGDFNVCSGEAIQLRDLIQLTGEACGVPELIGLGEREAPAHEPPVVLGDGSKLKQATGWSPQISLEEGVADTIAWWRGKIRGH